MLLSAGGGFFPERPQGQLWAQPLPFALAFQTLSSPHGGQVLMRKSAQILQVLQGAASLRERGPPPSFQSAWLQRLQAQQLKVRPLSFALTAPAPLQSSRRRPEGPDGSAAGEIRGSLRPLFFLLSARAQKVSSFLPLPVCSSASRAFGSALPPSGAFVVSSSRDLRGSLFWGLRSPATPAAGTPRRSPQRRPCHHPRGRGPD